MNGWGRDSRIGSRARRVTTPSWGGSMRSSKVHHLNLEKHDGRQANIADVE